MDKATVDVTLFNGQSIPVEITTESIESVLKNADFITLHVPAQKEYVIGEKEFDK